MAQIVLIHRIGQEQRSADGLEAEWLPDLAGGIRTAGFSDVADRIWRNKGNHNAIETRMTFYGYLFLQSGQMGGSSETLRPAEEEIADELALMWLERAAANHSDPRERATATRELAYVRGKIRAEEQGRGSRARVALKSLAKLRWFGPLGMALAERFIMKSLVQVSRYLTDDFTRIAVQSIVKEVIGPETRVMIGHSFGSVVAFEAAHLLQQPLPLLITLGSPLGLDPIIYLKLRPQPPVFPLNVRRWVNVADRDDLVAAEPDLTRFFSSGIPDGAILEGEYTVKNGAKPHSASFYLSKVEVGRPIGETLMLDN